MTKEDLIPGTSWKFEDAQKSLDTFVRGPLLRQIDELRADVRKLRRFIKSEGECSCFAEEICEGCALLNDTAKWEQP